MTSRQGPARRLYRTLRAPRFAAWLLVIASLWLVLGTIIPQTSLDSEAVESWARAHPQLDALVSPLGLHSAYSQPLFLGLLMVLAASTALCAWERTIRAVRTLRATGQVTAAQLDRLRRAESLALLPAEESEPGIALERAGAALRALGLRSTRGPSMLEASSGRWGIVGSPVFHWALVALIILIPVGRLTRSEGLMGVVAGSTRVDEEASYGLLERGPLRGSLTGLSLGVEPQMVLNLMDGEVDRGPAPIVTLEQGGALVARQQVVPNRPLRHGALTVHMSEIGVGAVYSLVTSEGVALTDHALIDVAEGHPTGYTEFGATYDNDAGDVVARLTFSVVGTSTREASAAPEDRRRLELEAIGPDGAAVSRVVAAGDQIDLGGGLALRVDVVDYYARLSVVHDWSVGWMYALFVIAMAAVSVSVLVPYRMVRLLVDTSGERPVFRVETRHSRGSPEFADRVRQALAPHDAEDE